MKHQRLGTVISMTLLLSSLQVLPLHAVVKVSTTQNSSASTGNWGSQVSSSTGTGTTAAYQVTWTGNINKQYVLIAIINTGTFDLLVTHLAYSTAKSNGDATNAPVLTFDLCSGTWDPTTFACSGTVTTIGTGAAGVLDVVKLIPVSNRLIVRITDPHNKGSNYLTLINSQNIRADIRSGFVGNS